MITESAIRAILPAVRGYAGERFITAKPGTPLDILNGTLCYTSNDQVQLDPGVVADKIREASVRVTPGGVESHSVELGSIARHVSDKLAATVNNARNVVMPVVRELTHEVEKVRAEILGGRAGDDEIIIVDVSNAYASGFLENIIKRHSVVTANDRPLPPSVAKPLMADMTSERFKEIIATGNVALDDDVLGLLELPQPGFTGTYLKEAIESPRFITENIIIANRSWSPMIDHQALLAYLFLLGTRNGRNTTVDLDSTMSAQVNQALNYYGNRLHRQLAEVHSAINSGLLLASSWSNDDGVVRVFGPTYRQWLEEGGSPEALLGRLYMSNNVGRLELRTSGDDMTGEGQLAALVKQYDRRRNTQIAQGRLTATNETNRVIRQSLVRHARTTIGDETQRIEMIGRINKRMDERPFTERDDLGLYIMRLVCIISDGDRYDSELFITTMQGVMADNDELTPSAGATLAATRILGKWLASQIEVME